MYMYKNVLNIEAKTYSLFFLNRTQQAVVTRMRISFARCRQMAHVTQ